VVYDDKCEYDEFIYWRMFVSGMICVMLVFKDIEDLFRCEFCGVICEIICYVCFLILNLQRWNDTLYYFFQINTTILINYD
jgi:hypothetical protein